MTFNLCQLILSTPLYKTLDTARHNRREVAKYPTVRSEIRVFSHVANQPGIQRRQSVSRTHPRSVGGGLAAYPVLPRRCGLSAVFLPKVWVKPNRAVGARRSASGQCLGIESQQYPQRSGSVFPFPGGQ